MEELLASPLLALLLAAFMFWRLRAQEQGRRIALLARYLGPYQIEKHMETLTQGYLRALGEAGEERQGQIWQLLRVTEDALAGEVARLAQDLAKANVEPCRVSRLPVYLPLATRLLPAATFDLRRAVALHAQGIQRVVQDTAAPARDRAFMLSAELYLLQHTCHWFCKSKTVASARLLARHQTPYRQVLAAVSAPTRRAYTELTGG